MKNSTAYFLIALTCTQSCVDPDTVQKQNPRLMDSSKVTNKKPGSNFMDTLTSILLQPFFSRSLQNERIRAIISPGEFESTTHDCYYQMNFSDHFEEDIL
jgi:hypothetical protein